MKRKKRVFKKGWLGLLEQQINVNTYWKRKKESESERNWERQTKQTHTYRERERERERGEPFTYSEARLAADVDESYLFRQFQLKYIIFILQRAILVTADFRLEPAHFSVIFSLRILEDTGNIYFHLWVFIAF
jgi:hypothetical protein